MTVILRGCLLFASFFFPFIGIWSISFVYPMPIVPMISGSIAEFRPYNLHLGLDARTFAVNHIPVLATADGWLHRLYGYKYGGFGKAIYLKHADDFLSVYGHVYRMDNRHDFNSAWYFYDLLSADPWFSVIFPDKLFRVNQEQTIAYSGDRGSGPQHLHFELWDKQGRAVHSLNPAILKIEDTIAPLAKKLWVFTPDFTFDKKEQRLQSCTLVLQKQTARLRQYECQQKIIADGKVAIKISAYDEIDSTANTLGVYTAELFLKDLLFYRITFDKIKRGQTSLAKYIFDQNLSNAGSRNYVYNLFFPHEAVPHKPEFIEFQNNGYLDLTQEKNGSLHEVKIILKDAVQNMTIIQLRLQKGIGKPYHHIGPSPKYDFKKGQTISRSLGNISVYSDSLLYPSNFSVSSQKAPWNTGLTAQSKLFKIRWNNSAYRPQPLKIRLFSPRLQFGGVFNSNGRFLGNTFDQKCQCYLLTIEYSESIYLAIDKSSPSFGNNYSYGPLEQSEYFIPVYDHGSGLSGKINLSIDGVEIEKVNIAKWNIRYDHDRYGFLIPTGIIPNQEKYQSENQLVQPAFFEIEFLDNAGNSSKTWRGYIPLAQKNLPRP